MKYLTHLVGAVLVLALAASPAAPSAAAPTLRPVAHTLASEKPVQRVDAPCIDHNIRGDKANTDHCVIGAVLYDQENYQGNSITLWIPKPCVKNGLQDYGWQVDPKVFAVRSLSVWSTCYGWIYSADPQVRDGAFKSGQDSGSRPTLGAWAGNVHYFTLS